MSVYTTLTLAEVQDFAAPYGLKVVDLIPIQAGIQNTNYFVLAQSGQHYVLTIFEEMNQQQATELIPILQHLSRMQLPVAAPLVHSGQAIHLLKNKPAQLAPRLQGQHPQPPTTAQVIAIAQAQAQMHVALKDMQLTREKVRDHAYWFAFAHEIKSTLAASDQAILNQLIERYETMTTAYPNRPKGWIHSDLFCDNTLFVEDRLTGILDFYELNYDELLFDIAITLNDFCTEYPKVTLNQAKVTAFLHAYAQVRPLSSDEHACLDLYLALVAGRFWLMRLQVAQKNQQQERTGHDILHKDPNEMRNILIERLKFVRG